MAARKAAPRAPAGSNRAKRQQMPHSAAREYATDRLALRQVRAQLRAVDRTLQGQRRSKGATDALQRERDAWQAAERALVERTRKNPPGELLTRSTPRGARGVLMSRHVMDLTYMHAESNQPLPYRHDFGGDVHMLGMPDGSIQLRHPDRRLWADHVVTEDA